MKTGDFDDALGRNIDDASHQMLSIKIENDDTLAPCQRHIQNNLRL